MIYHVQFPALGLEFTVNRGIQHFRLKYLLVRGYYNLGYCPLRYAWA